MADMELSPGEKIQLKEFILTILVEREKQSVKEWNAHHETHRVLETALSNNETLRVAEKASSNEWRGALSDTVNRNIQRVDYDQRNREIDTRFENIRTLTEMNAGIASRVIRESEDRNDKAISDTRTIIEKNMTEVKQSIYEANKISASASASLSDRLGNLEGRLTGGLAVMTFLIIIAGLVEHFIK
jgi:chromatin segregation and condensation protein Rec8/ScpA/Scc1 (kleisin family)